MVQFDQDVDYVRNTRLKLAFTVSLDDARTLDGTEAWRWTLRKTAKTGAVALDLTAPAGGNADILVDGAFQPTVVIDATDLSAEPAEVDVQDYVHELLMTKGGEPESVARGKFQLYTDIARAAE